LLINLVPFSLDLKFPTPHTHFKSKPETPKIKKEQSRKVSQTFKDFSFSQKPPHLKH